MKESGIVKTKIIVFTSVIIIAVIAVVTVAYAIGSDGDPRVWHNGLTTIDLLSYTIVDPEPYEDLENSDEVMQSIYNSHRAEQIRTVILTHENIVDCLVTMHPDLPTFSADSIYFGEPIIDIVVTLKDNGIISDQEVQNIMEIVRNSLHGIEKEHIRISAGSHNTTPDASANR